MLIAAFLALISLLGLILSITSGLIFSGIDGLFVVLICLLTGTIFGLMAVSMAIKGGHVPLPVRFRKAVK